MLRHGATYAGHTAATAAALANLAILEGEGLIARGAEMEKPLFDALNALADHPATGEVRGGVGTLAALDLDAELLERDPGALGRVTMGARKAGVLLRQLGRGVAVSPPLTATQEHFDLITQGIAAGLDAAANG